MLQQNRPYCFILSTNEHYRNDKHQRPRHHLRRARATSTFVAFAMLGWIFQPGTTAAQSLQDLIKLRCKDTQNDSLISVEIDPSIRRVTVEVPGSDVLIYDDGKSQNYLPGRVRAGWPISGVKISSAKCCFRHG